MSATSRSGIGHPITMNRTLLSTIALLLTGSSIILAAHHAGSRADVRAREFPLSFPLTSPSSTPSPDAPAHPPPSPPDTATTGFHWRQLESSSYPEYIANLRSIGCPEQTIADIIRADVHALYEQQRSHLRHRSAESPAPRFGGDTDDVSASLARLTREEAAVLTTLLGAHAGKIMPEPGESPGEPAPSPPTATSAETAAQSEPLAGSGRLQPAADSRERPEMLRLLGSLIGRVAARLELDDAAIELLRMELEREIRDGADDTDAPGETSPPPLGAASDQAADDDAAPGGE